MLRVRCLAVAVVVAVVLPLAGATGASAAIAPPWCGTPEPDAAESLPDGTDPTDPPGSFPHIPYYAIRCTLEDIQSRSDGRMSTELIGRSARGRDMYLVTINGLGNRAQRDSYQRLQQVLRLADEDPEEAKELIERRDVKVPIFIQSGIHGNEYEGVDAAMRAIERIATTPYGQDPVVDDILDNAVMVFNVVQNPDGRIAGTRANGNGFDLNRDYITQSQSETVASVQAFRRWLPTEVLDLHGYVEPTLLEGTTVPHNPGLEYDLWLKWSQPRLDANQAGLAAEGYGITRPVNNILPMSGFPRARRCRRAGMTGARSTPASTGSCAAWTPRRSRCAGRWMRPSAGSTARRRRSSAMPARCARRSWPCGRRSTSCSRTAAR